MSIDYDQLRELVDAATPGPWRADDESLCECCTDVTAPAAFVCTADMENAPLIALAPDMARELLRLRDGVEVMRDRCAALTKSAQNAGIRTLAREMDTNAKALTGLLNGDTE